MADQKDSPTILDSDTGTESAADVDLKLVGRLADQIVQSFMVARVLPMTAVSILTTALMFYLKQEIRASPAGSFENNKKVAASILDSLRTEIESLQEDARNSQDVQDPTGRVGTPNRTNDDPGSNGGDPGRRSNQD
jgi:hypothetical protein